MLSLRSSNAPTRSENVEREKSVACPPILWKAPNFLKSIGMLRLIKKTGRIGFEIVARNYQGHILAARSLTQSSIIDPTLAEAWAALHAFLFSKETRLFGIILE